MLLGDNPYFISHVNASYPMHCHNEIELLYCIHGEFKVIIEDEEFQLHEGCILFISSLAMHQIIIEIGVTAFVLEFGSQFLGAEYYNIAAKTFSKCLISPEDTCDYRNRFTKPLKRLYNEYINRKEGSHWAMQGLLLEIFTMIVRYVPMQQQTTQKQKNLDRYLKIQKVFDLVQEQYNEDISLERAALYVGYDPRAFCRLFKNITNMTFHDYLNLHRITVAMHLLEHKAYSIGEVGQMVGIPVAKSFSRLFRKYTGLSPSEYRNISLNRLYSKEIF